MARIGLRNLCLGANSDGMCLDGIDLEIADGEFVGVIGSSGAGKTTLLRVLAGLEGIDSGQVWFDDVEMTSVPPARRDVAMVFQQNVLLPHRDVRGNIAFPLEVRQYHDDEIEVRIRAETRALHIESLLTRPSGQLSEGERQLVQIARALVRVPSLLLLDEPLARLDAAQRQWMRRELVLLQEGYGVTALIATNDPVEAMTVPSRLIVLDCGRIIQTGVPLEVYDSPANLVAAALTGELHIETVDGRLRGIRPDGRIHEFDPLTGITIR